MNNKTSEYQAKEVMNYDEEHYGSKWIIWWVGVVEDRKGL